MTMPLFLSDPSVLVPSDAVAALLVLDDGRYIMQLRDDIPGIFYPGHWGCFGGAAKTGEEPEEALRRELFEELELEVSSPRFFTRLDLDFTCLGFGPVYRIFYEIGVPGEHFATLRLHEGAQVNAFAAEELLAQPNVTPYDAFAIWLHAKRAVLAPAGYSSTQRPPRAC